jgi:molybdopterin converting factor small subunit
MSTFCSVRALVRTEVADAARDKAETAGKTLADVVAELLESYVSKTPEPQSKSTKAS